MPSPYIMPSKSETILVVCAHSDDQIFGVGGSIAKWAKEGKKVVIFIFSFGEGTHPWLKKHVAAEMRINESLAASKIVGAKETQFFGLTEGKFPKETKEKKVDRRLAYYIKKLKPSKIFTHAIDDPHPDHHAVTSFVIDLCNQIKYTGDVYSFDVWTFVNMAKRDAPKLYVDISDTFHLKTKALKCFKSQYLAMIALLWSVYWRAIKSGKLAKTKYAEVFFKIR